MIWFTVPTNVKIDLGLFPNPPKGRAAKKVYEEEMVRTVIRGLNHWEFQSLMFKFTSLL